MLIGIIIYFLQSTAFAYFFTFFFQTQRKWFSFIAVLIFFNFIAMPVAVCISNPYLAIPLNMFLVYLMTRRLFKNEGRMNCVYAIVLYEASSLTAEMLMFSLLLLTNTDLTPATLALNYSPIFYILHYILLILMFSFFILRFGHHPFGNKKIQYWQILMMVIQILAFFIMTSNYYDVNLGIMIIYSMSYFVIMIYVWKKLIDDQEQRKMEMTSSYLQEQLFKQCEQYIQLRNQQQFRKLRHDYINFIEQRTILNQQKK